MRSFMIAVMLCFTSSIASAYPKIEAAGRVVVVSNERNYVEYGDLFVSGYCWGPCEFMPAQNGFTLGGVTGHHGAYIGLSIKYINGYPALGDANFHPVRGEWLFYFQQYMGTGVFYEYGEIRNARVIEDGVMDYYNYSFFPQSTITNIVRVGLPEPSSWAMMISGFAFVGAAIRRSYRLSFV